MLPLIGMMDSSRAMEITEKILNELERTQSKVVIIDISGIPTVDTLVAKHLIRTVSRNKTYGF